MKTNLKNKGNELIKLINSWLRDQNKIPEIVLNKNEELAFILNNKYILEKEFDCAVFIEKKPMKRQYQENQQFILSSFLNILFKNLILLS